MKRLWKYIRPYTIFIIGTVLIKLLAAVMELMLPYLMEIMLDEKVPAGELRAIYLYGGGMILCAFGCLLFNILANRMSAKSSGKITRAIRHDLFNKLQHLSARQMDEITVSSAESRLTSDTYNINQMLARLQRMGIRAPILLLGGTAITMAMDSKLALVMIAMLPLIFVIVYGVSRMGVPLYSKVQQSVDGMVRVVREDSQGIRVIKALSKEEKKDEEKKPEEKKELTLEEKYQLALQVEYPLPKYKGRKFADVLYLDPNAISYIATKYQGDPAVKEAAKIICEYAASQAA